jgi:hypothetical protein
MTLIAAFRCNGGLVIAADSQETITDEFGNQYRKTVQKIAPRVIGNYQLAVAGAGHAKLIEAFILHLERALKQKSLRGVTQFQEFVEGQLREFYASDVRLCPDEDKQIIIFIAAVCQLTKEYELWVSENVRLRTAAKDAPELIGVEYGLYTQTARRLFTDGMSMAQSVLASIYVLTLAEQTSNWVRGPMDVVTIKPNGIWAESAEYVRVMQDRLKEHESFVSAIFLSCADTSVPVHSLEKQLSEFSQATVALHRQHIDRQVRELTIEKLMSTNDPYPKFPLGSPILFTEQGQRIEHDEKEIRRKNAELIKNMTDLRKEKPDRIIFNVSIDENGVEYNELPPLNKDKKS